MKFKVNGHTFTGLSEKTEAKMEEFLKSLTDIEFQELNNSKTRIFRNEAGKRIELIKRQLKASK